MNSINETIQQENIYDVIIIGSGPTGLFGTFYASMNNLKTLTLEIDNVSGGSPLKLYPDKPIYDFPAIIKLTGKELIDNLTNQLNTVKNWEIKYNQNVKEIIKNENNLFEIKTSNEDLYFAKNIIISIGYGSFKFKTFSDHIIKIDKSLIHHYVDDLKKYHNKNIIVCGGGNSAIEYANLLSHIAKTVHLIHHTDKLKAFDVEVEKLMHDECIYKYLNYEILEINENHMLIKDNNSEETKKLIYDYILTFYGTELIHSNIYEINIWNNKRKIEVNEYFESLILNGLYACGTCNDKNYNNLLILGMSEICIAIDHIKGDKKSH